MSDFVKYKFVELCLILSINIDSCRILSIFVDIYQINENKVLSKFVEFYRIIALLFLSKFIGFCRVMSKISNYFNLTHINFITSSQHTGIEAYSVF